MVGPRVRGTNMHTNNSDDLAEWIEDERLLKLPYKTPALILLDSMDVESNPGFGADAGFSVGAS